MPRSLVVISALLVLASAAAAEAPVGAAKVRRFGSRVVVRERPTVDGISVEGADRVTVRSEEHTSELQSQR